MSLEQKLLVKLQPHADKVEAGNNNELDYLPAVLFRVLEKQDQQISTVKDQLSKTHQNLQQVSDSIQEKLREVTASVAKVKSDAETHHSNQTQQIVSVEASSKKRLDDEVGKISEILGSISTHKNLQQVSDSIQEKLREVTASVAKEIRFNRRLILIALAIATCALGVGIALFVRH